MAPQRTRGRPPVDDKDPAIAITVRVPLKQYDYMYAQAKRERVTLVEWLRRKTDVSDDSK